MDRAAFRQAAHETLPEEQRRARRGAVKWQVFTIAYTACTLVLVSLVLGGSQAMMTAWIEDMLSLLPQLSFLLALLFTRRAASVEHPYGWHRAMGVGHLLAGAALLGVGGILAFDSLSALLSAEAPEIGEVEILGSTVWQGWLMVAVMAVIMIGPFFYGRAKAKLAPVLHNKLLFADADMAKADWQTNVASIVGVLGVGAGIWWLDSAAALFISLGIVWDGLKNLGAALEDLMDRRARSYDGKTPHPLREHILRHARAKAWIEDASIRLRDEGQVFHVEVFVKPREPHVDLADVGELSAEICEIDWKVHDVVVVPTDPLPPYGDRGVGSASE